MDAACEYTGEDSLSNTADLNEQKSISIQELFSVLKIQEYFPKNFDKNIIAKITQLSDNAILQSILTDRSVTRFFDKNKKCRNECPAGFKFNQKTCECDNTCK